MGTKTIEDEIKDDKSGYLKERLEKFGWVGAKFKQKD